MLHLSTRFLFILGVSVSLACQQATGESDSRRGPDEKGGSKAEASNENSLPIACQLTPEQIVGMRDGLLPGLLAGASAQEDIVGGYRWKFSPRADLVKDIGSVIEAEHQCCPFLHFTLVVEPGDGPIWLQVSGPDGTKDFLSSLLRTTSGPSAGK
jgi:hypothetical protein